MKQIFKLQQSCVHSALTHTLKAGAGLELARAHQGSKGAQGALTLLSKDAKKSATVSLTSGGALTCITTARVGNGEQRGGVKLLMQRWSDQLRQRATLAPVSPPPSLEPSTLPSMLLLSEHSPLLEL